VSLDAVTIKEMAQYGALGPVVGLLFWFMFKQQRDIQALTKSSQEANDRFVATIVALTERFAKVQTHFVETISANTAMLEKTIDAVEDVEEELAKVRQSLQNRR
jgi:hypothetical protein